MSNAKFSNYVSSVAFNLTLSKKMINMLLWLSEQCDGQWYIWMIDGGTGRALKARGLVNFEDRITPEGRKVAELLVMAGYSKSDPKPICSTHESDMGKVDSFIKGEMKDV